jgi:D-serine deaminase-like pyridoxal phosphate-dependent protein
MPIPAPYTIADPSDLPTPALVVYPELVRKNVAELVRVAGSPGRLRPHAKTHKTREATRMLLDAGVTKHKCATLAEADMLAGCGAPDVLVAYALVGPNPARLAGLAAKYPGTRFSALIDHPVHAAALSEAFAAKGLAVEFFVDLNVGMNRTGIDVGPAAAELYRHAAGLPNLRPGGLHAYNGHHNHESAAEREAAVDGFLGRVLALRDDLERAGLPVPRVVSSGTPTFPTMAARDVPGLELSPGTLVFQHWPFRGHADLAGFVPALAVLTRVVSRPTPARVTFDAGNKSVAADPPLAKRAFLPALPDATAVGHNEEHLIVETADADRWTPGDVTVVLPGHVCPTVALHRRAVAVEGGRVVGSWEVAARDRDVSA